MSKTHHVPGSLCWFELATSDSAAAKNFYSSVLGWTSVDSPMGPDEVYTIFKIDGQDVAAGYAMRAEQRAQGMPPSWMVYILVKNADEIAARAKQLGGTVHVEPFNVMDHGRMSVIQDPTGASFCVWQAMTHSGTHITAVPGTVVWADLSTTDQVRGAKFYSDLFGWKMVEGESMKPAAPGTYYHIVNGTEMIGGVPPAEFRAPGVPSHWMLYFQVRDCDATVAKVKSLGGRVLVPATSMEEIRRYAVLTDAQGATFAIVQSLEAQAAKPVPKPAAKPAATTKPAAATKPAVQAAKPVGARKTEPAGRKTKPAARKVKSAARKVKSAARKTTKPTRSGKAKAKPARKSAKLKVAKRSGRKAGKAKK